MNAIDGTAAQSLLTTIPSSFNVTSTSSGVGTFILQGGKDGEFIMTFLISGPGSVSFNVGPTVSFQLTSLASPPKLASVLFADSGTFVTATFDSATNQPQFTSDSYCSTLFAFTGAGVTKCSWIDSATVRLTFPFSPGTPLLALNGTVTLLSNVIKAECLGTQTCNPDFSVGNTVTAASPLNPVKPTVVINVPATIGSCADLIVDASGSLGFAGRAWKSVSWVVFTIPSDSTSLQQTLNGQSLFQPYTIPASTLAQFQSFITFTLQVTNYLGQTSLAYALVSLSGQMVPTVSIIGSSSLQNQPSNPVLVSATATAPSCISGQMTYQWAVVLLSTGESVTLPSTIRTNRVSLSLPAYTLTAGQRYALTFTAYLNGVSASATTNVAILLGNIVAIISGGSNQQVSSTLPLILDASSSLDTSLSPSSPRNLDYYWSCVITNVGVNYLQPCGISLTNGAVLTVPPSTLVPSTTYKFEVTVKSADGRSNYANVVVGVVGIPAAVSINALPSGGLFNRNSPLKIGSSIDSDVNTKATWIVTGNGNSSSILTPTVALSPISQTLTGPLRKASFPLSVAPNVFVPGSTYTFRLTISLADQSSAIFSEIKLTVRFPPSSGTFSVSPLTGTALSTLFQFTASGWSAGDVTDLPLTYSMSVLVPYTMSIQTNALTSSASALLSATAGTTAATTVSVQLLVSGSTGSVSSPVVTTAAVFPNIALASDTSALTSLFNGQVSKALSASDPQAVAQAVGLIASTLTPSTNCSTPVRCARLNRGNCSDTAFTCGSCLPGYDGVIGDYNGLCLPSSRRRLAFGKQEIGMAGPKCSSNYDCQSAVCLNGVCLDSSLVSKKCPSGCSGGNGNCKFVHFVTGSTLTQCSISDPSCVARCTCNQGYAGLDCSIPQADALAKSKLRGQLCSALGSSLGFSDTTVTTVQGLNQAFDYVEVNNMTDISACATVLQSIVNIVNSKLSVQSDTNSMADLVSAFLLNSKLYGDSYGNAPIGLVLTNAVNSIAKSSVYGMDGGEYPKTTKSTGFALTVKTVATESLHGTTISVGSGANTFQQSIILPPSGLDACGYGSYTQYAVAEWIGNQYNYMTPSKKPILNEVLQFIALNSSKYPKGSATPGNHPFKLVLKFAQAQNWSTSVPDCRLIGYGFQGGCSCQLTRYNAFNVTFTCPDVVSLCTTGVGSTSTSSGADSSVNVLSVSNFGVSRGDLTPTSRPTSLPSSAAPSIRPSSKPTAPSPNPSTKLSFAPNQVFINAAPAKTIDRASGPAFFTIYLTTTILGLLVFLYWDYIERRTFHLNKERISSADIPATGYAAQDAFTTAGLDTLSMISFTERQNDPLATIGKMSGKAPTTGDEDTFWKKIFRPISLKTETGWLRFVQALFRHHSAFRYATYGSLRLGRALRYLCFMTDMLIIIFMDTAFYALAFPSQNNCTSYTSSTSCLKDKSYWTDDSHQCTWNGSYCDVRNPSGGFAFYLAIVLVIITVALLPLRGIKWVFEQIFSKEILWEKKEEADENVDGEEILGRDAKIGFVKSKQILKEINLFAECDDHLKNRHLEQHYISEKIENENKILGYLTRKHFFVLDSALPESISIVSFLGVLIPTVALWIFFIVYIYNWVTTNTDTLVYSWGVTFIFTWLVQIFIVEVIGIVLVYVLPVHLIQSRLERIRQELDSDRGTGAAEDGLTLTNVVPDASGTGVRRDFAAPRAPRQVSSDFTLTMDKIYGSGEEDTLRGIDTTQGMMSPFAPPNVVAAMSATKPTVDMSAATAAEEPEDLSPEAEEIAGNSDEDEWYAGDTDGRQAGI